MPPAPMAARISYEPSRVPVASGMGSGDGPSITPACRLCEAEIDCACSRRDPNRDKLRIVVGDATVDDQALGEAVRGQDAVISSLGVGGSFKPAGLIARSAPRIVRAMEQHRVNRLIFTSAFGVDDTWRDTPLVPRMFIRTRIPPPSRTSPPPGIVARASDCRSAAFRTFRAPTGPRFFSPRSTIARSCGRASSCHGDPPHFFLYGGRAGTCGGCFFSSSIVTAIAFSS